MDLPKRAHDAAQIEWSPVAGRLEESRSGAPSRPRALLASVTLGLLGTGLQFAGLRACSVAEKESPAQGDKVAAPARAVPAGALLRAADFVPVPLSREMCLSGLVPWEKVSSLEGQRVRAPLAAGAAMRRSMLLSHQGNGGVPDGIPPGKRLFLLSANLGPLAGVLGRGDRVDVVGHINLPGKGFVTKTLLSGERIVSLDKSGGSSAQTISLHLTPKDVEFLAHAQRLGTLTVALRNPMDDGDPGGDEGMTESQFLNDKRISEVFENDLFQIRKGEREDE